MALVSPVTHCKQGYETEQTKVGSRSLGDARYDYVTLFTDWFDYWLKDAANDVLERDAVELYTMGANIWTSYREWPPAQAREVTYYLASEGDANSRFGTGSLAALPPEQSKNDSFTYDPSSPGTPRCAISPAGVVWWFRVL